MRVAPVQAVPPLPGVEASPPTDEATAWCGGEVKGCAVRPVRARDRLWCKLPVVANELTDTARASRKNTAFQIAVRAGNLCSVIVDEGQTGVDLKDWVTRRLPCNLHGKGCSHPHKEFR